MKSEEERGEERESRGHGCTERDSGCTSTCPFLESCARCDLWKQRVAGAGNTDQPASLARTFDTAWRNQPNARVSKYIWKWNEIFFRHRRWIDEGYLSYTFPGKLQNASRVYFPEINNVRVLPIFSIFIVEKLITIS